MDRANCAAGKLLLDLPAEAVARLRITNPERRNALDHEILDAIAETMPRLDRGIEIRCVLITGEPPVFSAGYDIATIPDRDLRARRRGARRPSLPRRPRGDRRPPLADGRGDQRPLPRRRRSSWRSAATCGSAPRGAKLGMPPAKLGLVYGHTGLRKFIDTVGLRADQGALPHAAATSRRRGPSRSAWSTRWSPTTRWSASSIELAAEIAANAPLSMRGNKSAIETLNQNPMLSDAQEAG